MRFCCLTSFIINIIMQTFQCSGFFTCKTILRRSGIRVLHLIPNREIAIGKESGDRYSRRIRLFLFTAPVALPFLLPFFLFTLVVLYV
uniref:Secreted protein n=1 Tax=Panstrongylus lignarius TaxID=156445 RepID=A0A224XZ09_9HEMI